ncbi:hypothetical protein LJB86_02755 [Deltaproteobacteria bacterium OttesenSCG-928-M10]|nr:hypothetical protein [Deltaproteobacteria bacterium OttesenSCG-928-M10]
MPNTNEIIPFAFGDNLVRIIRDENGDPWWVAKDVCAILELSDVSMSLRNLEDDEKGTSIICTPGGPQEMLVVNEPGLYSLIFRSRKPEAREFRRWVTHEVLPAIRCTGRYIHPAAEAPERLALDFDSLPEDVRRLKPRTRERCMHLALQSARLSGVSSQEDQLDLFIDFCRLLGSPGLGEPARRHEEIDAYIDQRLVAAPGAALQSDRVYSDFRCWWAERFPNRRRPAPNVFGQVMGGRFQRQKSNRHYYLDIAFRQEG